MKITPFCSLLMLAAAAASAQSRANDLAVILARQLETADVVSYQLRQYLYHRLAPLPHPSTAQEWTAETARLRRHLLDEVIFLSRIS